MYRATTLLFLFWAVCCATLLAQSPPEKFGKISDDHKNFDHVPGDSLASVVILFDYGDVTFENDLEIRFKRHKRIKILNEAGLDWADVSIPYYDNESVQSVQRLKAHTLNFDERGKQQKETLRRRDFYDEDIDENWNQVKFSFPAVRPGSIIEYQYELVSSSAFYFPSWTFQHSEPTLHSEFNAEIPEVYHYRILTQGSQFFDENETTDGIRNYLIHATSRSHSFGERPQDLDLRLRTKNYRYVMKDMPALREEPHMRSTKDYFSKMIFQYSEFRMPNRLPEPVLNSWDEVASRLASHINFGRQLNSGRRYQNIVDEIIDVDQADEYTIMTAIYDHIRKSVAWDGYYSVLASDRLDNIYERKSGKIADINLLLTALLSQAGLEAAPVFTSTRQNGRIWKMNPFLDQFNYVLATVEIDGRRYFLDATDPNRPHTLLPFRVLNSDGWIVDKTAHEWVVLENEVQNQQIFNIRAALKEDGSLEADYSSSETGYYGLERRKEVQQHNRTEEFFREKVFTGITGIDFEKIEITDPEDERRFTARAKAQLHDAGEFFNDMIFLNPVLVHKLEENPFTLPERSFPVDFGYTRSYQLQALIDLPEGYEVVEMPNNTLLRSPDNSLEIRRICKVEGGQAQFLFAYRMEKSVFEPDEYEALRGFFSQYLALQEEQFVLQRTEN